MRSIGLEVSDRIEHGPGIGREPIGVEFMRHSPFGEPEAQYKEKLLAFMSIGQAVVRPESGVRSSVSRNASTQSLIEEERKWCDDS
jgi:hypothetical protein